MRRELCAVGLSLSGMGSRTRSTLSDLEPKRKVAREAWDMAIQARDEVSALARSSR
jgi:hypothetical protein